MKKFVASAVCFVLILSTVSFGQVNGVISGVASIDGKPLPNITVRVRDIGDGQLVGHTNATATGQFVFSELPPGNYVIEMIAANGAILGTSVTIALTPAVMVATNVALAASAAAVAPAAIGVANTAGLSATVIAVAAVGLTLGTTAVVVAANDMSPSR